MPREVMTLRLDQRFRRRLSGVARRRGRTPSDVAREALEAWLADQEGVTGEDGPFPVIEDLIGVVRGGDPGRSTKGARAIAASIRSRVGVAKR